MTISRVVAGLCAAASLIAGCRSTAVGDIPTAIEGIVIDETGKPVEGAQIITEPATISVDTTADGKYLIDRGLEARNTYRVSASKAGFLGASATFVMIEGAPQTFDFVLVGAKGLLKLTRTSVDLGAVSTRDTIVLANVGAHGTKVTWSASVVDDWLVVDPTAGTLADASTVMTLRANRTKFGTAYGTKTANVEVVSDAGNATFIVTLTHPEPGKPVLSASVEELAFDTIATSRGVVLRNTGTGTLEWRATALEPWVSVEPSSGSLIAGPSQIVTLSADRTGLSLGAHETSVKFDSAQPDIVAKTVRVTAVVEEHPELEVVTPNIELTGNEATSSFRLRNAGTGTVHYVVGTPGSPWLTILDTGSGTIASGAVVDVTFRATRRGAPPGRRALEVPITSDGGNAWVVVGLSQAPTAELDVDPQRVDVGDGDRGTLRVVNVGLGSGAWRITQKPAWITAVPASGTLTSYEGQPPAFEAITLSVDRRNKPPGPISGSIDIELVGGPSLNVPVQAMVPFARWRQVTKVGPSARINAATAVLPGDGRLVVFGGSGVGNGTGTRTFNDTWTYDRTRDEWARVESSAAPNPRAGATLVWDEVRQRLVLFGMGLSGVTTDSGDTLAQPWSFDGGRWLAYPAAMVSTASTATPNTLRFLDLPNAKPVLFAESDTLTAICGSRANVDATASVRYDLRCAAEGSGCYTKLVFEGFCSGGAIARVSADTLLLVTSSAGGGSGLAQKVLLLDAATFVTKSRATVSDAFKRSRFAAFARGHEVYLFGGDNTALAGPDPLRNTLIRVKPDLSMEEVVISGAPPPRVNMSAAYDPGADVAYVFGGETMTAQLQVTQLNELWLLEFAR